jgi:hypothetical protein
MKEYIEKTLYDASGLTVGTNKRGTVIFAQNNEYVLLDAKEVKEMMDAYNRAKPFGEFDGFSFSLQPKGIMLRQQGHSVYVDRTVFSHFKSR